MTAAGNAMNVTRARDTGAVELAEAALVAHAGNERVVEEARDLLKRLFELRRHVFKFWCV